MKTKTLAAVAAILVAAGAFYEHVAVGSPVSALQAFYQEYNEDYFGNRLPKNPVITITDLGDNMGESFQTSSGTWHIGIDRRSNPVEKQRDLTLIHEMCHVDLHVSGINTLDQHGEEFQSCMVRIAKQGGFKELW